MLHLWQHLIIIMSPFGDSGAAQVKGGSAAQIGEKQAGNGGWEQNHQSALPKAEWHIVDLV